MINGKALALCLVLGLASAGSIQAAPKSKICCTPGCAKPGCCGCCGCPSHGDANDIMCRVMGADGASGQLTVREADMCCNLLDKTFVWKVNGSSEIEFGDATLSADQIGFLTGFGAMAEVQPETGVVKKIHPYVPDAVSVSGKVSAVESIGRTLTVLGSRNKSTPVIVAGGADVRIKSAKVNLDSVMPGDTVKVFYVPAKNGQLVATRIDVSAPKPKSISGNLESVDTAAGTATVATKTGSLALIVGLETDLRINGKRSPLTKLAEALATAQTAGRTVKISGQYFARQTNIASKIQANVKTSR